MSFSIFDTKLVFCTSEDLLIFENSELQVQKLPKAPIEKQPKAEHNLDPDSLVGITSVTFSNDGSLFVVCANRKQLYLYSSKDNSLLSNRTLVRAASRVRFTPLNDVIVADKSGDAYLFSTKKPDEPGELILGHLSMLLDILVTEDGKFVVTADRDEKIRISHFPNAYNIQAFCLGHKTFVSNISQIPGAEDLLVSSGGDGDIKIWNFAEGKEVCSVSFMEHIEENFIASINEALKDMELTEDVKNLPVKHMRIRKIGKNGNKTVVVLSFYGSGVYLIYELKVEGAEKKIDIKYLQTIQEKEEPLDITVVNENLWILSDEGVRIYKFNENSCTFVIDEENIEALKTVNGVWKKSRSKISKQMFYQVLYKRKFDNVQEYQEKKKSRLKVSN
uniref:Uncharacterized protein n=1 Tax=Bracon brevicornis TaxID=1563983 RepID=A0A6V7KR70_9HYME